MSFTCKAFSGIDLNAGAAPGKATAPLGRIAPARLAAGPRADSL
jgi:hypothetical protein